MADQRWYFDDTRGCLFFFFGDEMITTGRIISLLNHSGPHGDPLVPESLRPTAGQVIQDWLDGVYGEGEDRVTLSHALRQHRYQIIDLNG